MRKKAKKYELLFICCLLLQKVILSCLKMRKINLKMQKKFAEKIFAKIFKNPLILSVSCHSRFDII